MFKTGGIDRQEFERDPSQVLTNIMINQMSRITDSVDI
jgi:hypothetical protein